MQNLIDFTIPGPDTQLNLRVWVVCSKISTYLFWTKKGFFIKGGGGSKKAGLYNFALLSLHISIWAFLFLFFFQKHCVGGSVLAGILIWLRKNVTFWKRLDFSLSEIPKELAKWATTWYQDRSNALRNLWYLRSRKSKVSINVKIIFIISTSFYRDVI